MAETKNNETMPLKELFDYATEEATGRGKMIVKEPFRQGSHNIFQIFCDRGCQQPAVWLAVTQKEGSTEHVVTIYDGAKAENNTSQSVKTSPEEVKEQIRSFMNQYSPKP